MASPGRCQVRYGGEPVLYVRDNGLGIPPRYHDKVFGLFERPDLDEGTGVGLTIVKRVVEVTALMKLKRTIFSGKWRKSAREGDFLRKVPQKRTRRPFSAKTGANTDKKIIFRRKP